MPASTDETIGTSETYTTIQAWEDDIPTTLASAYVGRCKGEAFGVAILNGHTTSESNYYSLEGKVGARHDGRSHEVSAAGNARIEWATAAIGLMCQDEHTRVRWMEISGPGALGQSSVRIVSVSTSKNFIHHNIIHNSLTSVQASQWGIRCEDSQAEVKAYRNILYGLGANGIDGLFCATASAFLLNTLYACNDDGINSAIVTTVESNASFNSANQDIDGVGTEDDNATSDATGDSAAGIASLTAANEFTNATTTWANTDLSLKRSSTLTGKATKTYSEVTYPEINIGIDGSTIVTAAGAWDVGAYQDLREPELDRAVATESTISGTHVRKATELGYQSIVYEFRQVEMRWYADGGSAWYGGIHVGNLPVGNKIIKHAHLQISGANGFGVDHPSNSEFALTDGGDFSAGTVLHTLTGPGGNIIASTSIDPFSNGADAINSPALSTTATTIFVNFLLDNPDMGTVGQYVNITGSLILCYMYMGK